MQRKRFDICRVAVFVTLWLPIALKRALLEQHGGEHIGVDAFSDDCQRVEASDQIAANLELSRVRQIGFVQDHATGIGDLHRAFGDFLQGAL